MTTYPLSEPATIYASDPNSDATAEVVGRGSLEDCAGLLAGLDADRLESIVIQMDDLDLRYGNKEVGELLRFLREESAGLSNNEIAEIKKADL